jgi:hypothetical protein
VLLLALWWNAMTPAISALRPDLNWVVIVSFPVALAIGNLVIGALYRVGLEADHPDDPGYRVGPSGFAWGALEWRILVTNLMVGLIWGVLALFAFILTFMVFGIVAAFAGANSPSTDPTAVVRAFLGPAGLAALMVAIPSTVGLIVLAAKLSLFAVTVADTGKFEFGRAWSLTRGATWALIVAGLLVFAISVAAGVIVEIADAGAASGASAMVWVGIAIQAAAAAVSVPAANGMVLYVYRRSGPTLASPKPSPRSAFA